MKRVIAAALGAAGLLVAANAAARAPVHDLVDCPLRDAPFSTASPLIDLFLNKQATAVVDKAFPGLVGRLPMNMGTTPPSFAAILSIKEARGLFSDAKPDFTVIDRELAAIPVTRADKVARCGRYDTAVPDLALPPGRPRLLLFEKINGFKDVPGFNAAHDLFLDLARQRDWAIIATDKGAAMNRATLRQFDVVVFNNISGDVLTLSQRRAFQSYIEDGGAFIGVHGTAGDPIYFWDWYVDRLIGARFMGHPAEPQFQDARIVLDEVNHPAASGLPLEWTMNDEWYSFRTDPRKAGARIIATLDERSYKPEFRGQDLRMGNHPIAWTNCIGRGRMFYSAIGHRPETYASPHYRQMLINAVTWTTDRRACAK